MAREDGSREEPKLAAFDAEIARYRAIQVRCRAMDRSFNSENGNVNMNATVGLPWKAAVTQKMIDTYRRQLTYIMFAG